MSEAITGGPAFPCHTIAMHEGMTLRDYFAAKAMQSLLADQKWNGDSISADAYEMADAMMKARVS